MHHWSRILLFFAALLSQETVHATKLSWKEYQTFTNSGRQRQRREVHRRQDDDSDSSDYVNAVIAVFDSDQGNAIQQLGEIACTDVQALEADPTAASIFINSIITGAPPPLIASNLPDAAASEFASEFSDLLSLASDAWDVGGDDANAYISVFNDIQGGYTDGATYTDDIDTAALDRVSSAAEDFYYGGITSWGSFGCGDECPSTTYCSPPAAASATITPGWSSDDDDDDDDDDYSSSLAYYSTEELPSYSSALSAYYSSVSAKDASATNAPSTPNKVTVTQATTAIHQQTITQNGNGNGQSTSSSAGTTPSPSKQGTSGASRSFGWGLSGSLILAASGVLGLAVWL